jgi:hypothetical protein
MLTPLLVVVLVVVVLMVVGPSRVSRLGRQLGATWRGLVSGFREGTRDAQPAALAARACPRCGVWSADSACYCTRCGAALG